MSTLSQEQVAAFRLLHTDVVDAVSAAVQGKRSVVELTVNGTGKDGTPACATVKVVGRRVS